MRRYSDGLIRSDEPGSYPPTMLHLGSESGTHTIDVRHSTRILRKYKQLMDSNFSKAIMG